MTAPGLPPEERDVSKRPLIASISSASLHMRQRIASVPQKDASLDAPIRTSERDFQAQHLYIRSQPLSPNKKLVANISKVLEESASPTRISCDDNGPSSRVQEVLQQRIDQLHDHQYGRGREFADLPKSGEMEDIGSSEEEEEAEVDPRPRGFGREADEIAHLFFGKDPVEKAILYSHLYWFLFYHSSAQIRVLYDNIYDYSSFLVEHKETKSIFHFVLYGVPTLSCLFFSMNVTDNHVCSFVSVTNIVHL